MPTDHDGYAAARAARAAGDAKKALRLYGTLLEREPEHLAARFERGTVREALGDLPGAIDDFGRIIELRPDLGRGWGARGSARFDADDVAGAIADLERAITIDREDTVALHNLAVAYSEKERFADAIAVLNRLLRRAPDHARARTNRGYVRMRLGRDREALDDFDRVVKEVPKQSALPRLHRATILAKRGDLKAARKDLEKARTLVRVGPLRDDIDAALAKL